MKKPSGKISLVVEENKVSILAAPASELLALKCVVLGSLERGTLRYASHGGSNADAKTLVP
jgi:hypothetical protein